jgi:hypothetical protein
MSTDFERSFCHFISEIAPDIPVLKGCEFSFDYEKRKLKIHCKNKEHLIEVNNNLESFVMFLPGEYFHFVSPDYDKSTVLSKVIMVVYFQWYIERNPDHPRQYFHFDPSTR